MSDERTVAFHPVQPGWYFHHYSARSHDLVSYPVVGFESVPLPYVPDPNTVANPDPRLIEARMEYIGTDAIVAIVLAGRPGEVTFRVRSDEPVGAVDGCSANWLGLYPSSSREELNEQFGDDIETMRENLRKGTATDTDDS